MFREVLLQNGYLEYDEDVDSYKINPDTKCYFCGLTYKEHQHHKLNEMSKINRFINISDSSTEYEKNKNG